MQYLSNFHSHCNFCDGHASMEAFVQYAVSKGFKAYGISSHAPVSFTTRWAMNYDDLQEYLQEYRRLKANYLQDIELYIGLEIDFLPEEKDAVFLMHRSLPLDYRIGSIHYINSFPDGTRWNVDGDPRTFMKATEEVFGGDIKKLVTCFYTQTCEMIDTCNFDIIGHLDKVAGNSAQYPEFSITDKWYIDLVKDTLALIKEKNIILEINTKALLRKGVTFPHQQFYPFIKEMQIPVMVNSDCHRPDLILSGLEETYQALASIGIKSVRILKQGTWTDMPIEQTPCLISK
jgi:histidinol-phosphatase (PHP family)